MSAKQFGDSLSKFMIPIALFEKFGSLNLFIYDPDKSGLTSGAQID